MTFEKNGNAKQSGGIVRLFGVNIDAKKKLRAALPYIYGIGKRNVFDICIAVGLDPDMRMFNLTEDQLAALRKYVEENVKVEGELRGEVSSNIKLLIAIGCYRGIRHRKGLPVRGQRTKTNARTRKGKSKNPVAGKKKITK
jgi:small subunit ribosomal protein S13